MPALPPDALPPDALFRFGEDDFLPAAKEQPGPETREVAQPVAYPHQFLVLGVEPLDGAVADPPPLRLEREGIDDELPPVRQGLHERGQLRDVDHGGIRPKRVQPYRRLHRVKRGIQAILAHTEGRPEIRKRARRPKPDQLTLF